MLGRYKGFAKLMEALLHEWREDITKRQIGSVVGGIGPLSIFKKLGKFSICVSVCVYVVHLCGGRGGGVHVCLGACARVCVCKQRGILDLIFSNKLFEIWFALYIHV